MKVTISLKAELVKEARVIAAERRTTVAGMVRGYLQSLVSHRVSPEQLQRNREALERSFQLLRINSGGHTWRRKDLYEREQ